MTMLSRFSGWWMSQWRSTSKLGEAAMLIAPVFLGYRCITVRNRFDGIDNDGIGCRSN